MGQQPRADRYTRPRPAPTRGRRGGGSPHAAKITVAVVSLLVMSFTGYAWATFGELLGETNLADDGPRPADGATDILLIGSDSRTDAQGNPLPADMLAKLDAGEPGAEHNTDTLILLHIPNDGSKAVGVSLPRDSYVHIPGFGKHKINSAYARAKLSKREELKQNGVTDPAKLERLSSEQGAETLIDTVEQLSGYTIDHYASVNLLGFYSITQAVGGVKVCLRNPVHDSYSGANFPKGVQTISGADALAFVRQRHGLPRNDLDRVRRQQAFMAGLARKVLSADTLTDPGRLNALADAIKKSVVLDEGWNIVSFAKRMRGLTGGQVEFDTIPVSDVSYRTPNDGVAVKVDPQRVHAFIDKLDGPAQDAQSPTSDAADSRIDPATLTVHVRNGNGTSNLAGDVSTSLTSKGFGKGLIGNTPARSTTVVRVPAGERAAGERVAKALPGTDIPVRESASAKPGEVTVLLGDDYPRSPTGPATGQPTESAAPEPATGSGSATEPPQGQDSNAIDANGIPCVN